MAEPNTYLGIDLGGTKIALGLVQEGNIIKSLKKPIVNTKDAQVLLNQIKEMVNELNPQSIAGIGVGVPGLVDSKSGHVYDVYNIPAFTDINLTSKLRETFGLPVCIQNDANCFALGEFLFGRGRGTRNMVGITLGTGMGTGIIAEGMLIGGHLSGAGEFGCMPYLDGVLEDYVSGTFFRTVKGESGEDCFAQAKQGDQWALAAYQEFGHHLGYAINQILFAYAPEMVIIGGAVAEAFDLYEETMRKQLEEFPFSRLKHDLSIVPQSHGKMAIVGGAALCTLH